VLRTFLKRFGLLSEVTDRSDLHLVQRSDEQSGSRSVRRHPGKFSDVMLAGEVA